MYGLTVHVSVLFYGSSKTSKIFAVETIFRVVFHIMPLNSFETTEEVFVCFFFCLERSLKALHCGRNQRYIRNNTTD